MRWFFGILGLWLLSVGVVQAAAYRIYLDADRLSNSTAARAIEVGVRAAIAERGAELAGVSLEVVPLDHRSNVRRTQKHLERFLRDENAIAVFGGQQSPNYLKAQRFINENTIPVLLPWSAATPLTRSDGDENTIFRLSLDDSKAAEVIIPFALNQQGCTHLTLLLWNSGWGKSNEATMKQEMAAVGFTNYDVVYFNGNLDAKEALSVAAEIERDQLDCVIYVGGSDEARTLFDAFLQTDVTPRIISHWGITGGVFENMVAASDRDRFDLTFIQTCYSFAELQSRSAARMARIQAAFPDDFDAAGYIAAPAGFIHGFDLGLLLVEALKSVDHTADIAQQRAQLIAALHQLDAPVEGLLKTYQTPFADSWREDHDAHEALETSDFCMSRFDEQDRIVMIQERGN